MLLCACANSSCDFTKVLLDLPKSEEGEISDSPEAQERVNAVSYDGTTQLCCARLGASLRFLNALSRELTAVFTIACWHVLHGSLCPAYQAVRQATYAAGHTR